VNCCIFFQMPDGDVEKSASILLPSHRLGNTCPKQRRRSWALAHYKVIDTSSLFIALDLQRHLLAGTFEHTRNHLLDHEIDLPALPARYRNDRSGVTAWVSHPRTERM